MELQGKKHQPFSITQPKKTTRCHDWALKKSGPQVRMGAFLAGILMRGFLEKGFHSVAKGPFYHPSRTCGRPKKRNPLGSFFQHLPKKFFLFYLNYLLLCKEKNITP
ncbi:hypothetical protein [uncultured Bilophila sp.]|uniref:hypothetical protein n=1 Tax=uncultured Bilophila sp. TaxID=529385 RepID=UPI00280BA7DD|nr:hypothetical protein [uncultured Bilophila sp.]